MTAALCFLIRLYRTLLNSDATLQAGIWEVPACVDFKAVGSLGRRLRSQDIFGMAALFCWQQFVMVAANLFTEENFAYYDFMLSHVANGYQ